MRRIEHVLVLGLITASSAVFANCGDDAPQPSSGAGAGQADHPSTAPDAGNTACAATGSESACLSCTKSSCCSEFGRCLEANPNCECALDCITKLQNPENSDRMTCASDCGVGHEAMSALVAVLSCSEACSSCPGAGAAPTAGMPAH